MQTMRRIGVQINGKLVGSCDSISKVSSPLFKDILDPWIDIKGFVPEKPSLNKNQQVVLDVLKKNANQGLDELIVGGITYMSDEEIDAIELSQQEELYQVLAAFAEWGKKEVAE